jgi:hypothetical protein
MVTKPSHSGSKGVTLTMMPQRAYVDFPTQRVKTSLGIRKYSTVVIDDRIVNIRKDFEFISHSNIVAIRRKTVRDDAFFDLPGLKRFNHTVLTSHLFNPMIGFNGHT